MMAVKLKSRSFLPFPPNSLVTHPNQVVASLSVIRQNVELFHRLFALREAAEAGVSWQPRQVHRPAGGITAVAKVPLHGD